MSSRSESLAALHGLARNADAALAGGYALCPLAAKARSHGLAAVRAIRETKPGECRQPDQSRCIRIIKPHGLAYNESRLAFRAALAACGIRGAL